MSRYDELVSILMDGEPTESELTELEQMLKENPELAKELRDHLLTWESWSQSVAPERSPESFLAACHTRLKAEADSTHFRQSTMRQITPTHRPIAWASGLAAAALITLAFLYSLKPPGPDNPGLTPSLATEPQSVSIEGESVCTQCTLNQEGGHNKGVRFTGANGAIQLLLLKRDPSLRVHTPHFCGGPTPVLVAGTLVREDGQELLATTSLEFNTNAP